MYDVVDYVQNNRAVSDWEVIVHHVFVSLTPYSYHMRHVGRKLVFGVYDQG